MHAFIAALALAFLAVVNAEVFNVAVGANSTVRGPSIHVIGYPLTLTLLPSSPINHRL